MVRVKIRGAIVQKRVVVVAEAATAAFFCQGDETSGVLRPPLFFFLLLPRQSFAFFFWRSSYFCPFEFFARVCASVCAGALPTSWERDTGAYVNIGVNFVKLFPLSLSSPPPPTPYHCLCCVTELASRYGEDDHRRRGDNKRANRTAPVHGPDGQISSRPYARETAEAPSPKFPPH